MHYLKDTSIFLYIIFGIIILLITFSNLINIINLMIVFKLLGWLI